MFTFQPKSDISQKVYILAKIKYLSIQVNKTHFMVALFYIKC